VRERRRRRDEMNFGPRLGVRPWIIAAGISVGLAMGVKWSGLYAAAAFGILLVAWDVHSRYRAGVVHPWLGMLIRDSIPSFLKLVPVAFVSYLACWAGWIRSDDAWDRQWAAENTGWWQSLPDWLQWLPSLVHYHSTAYSFHVGLDSEHPYMSNPWGWIVQWRPTSFYYESYGHGDMGCVADKCSSAVTSVGNPVIWGLAGLARLGRLMPWSARRALRPWRYGRRGGQVLLGDHLGGHPGDLGPGAAGDPRLPRRVDHPPRRPPGRHPRRTGRDLAAVVRLPGTDHLHLLHHRHGPL